jgi:hypothetical protein
LFHPDPSLSNEKIIYSGKKFGKCKNKNNHYLLRVVGMVGQFYISITLNYFTGVCVIQYNDPINIAAVRCLSAAIAALQSNKRQAGTE